MFVFLGAEGVPSASAAEVTRPTQSAAGGAVVIQGGDERNDLIVTTAGNRTIEVEDRASPLTAGAGCSAESPFVVRCPAVPPGGSRITSAFLGGGDDSIVFRGDGVGFARGGAGNDVIIGSLGPDILLGGGGDDRLEGRSGRDVLDGDGALGDDLPGNDDLRAGTGADILQGGLGDDRVDGGADDDIMEGDPTTLTQAGSRSSDAGSDTLIGGPGTDHLVYNLQPSLPSEAPRLVAPTLAITLDGRADDGPAGERDDVRPGMERAYSLSTATLNPLPGVSAPVIVPLADRRGRLLTSKVGARIYRLTPLGTRGGEAGLFEGSPFRVGDVGSADRPITLVLTGGDFTQCPMPVRATAARATRRSSARTVIRQLRARASGRFRTSGRHSAATVRGTAWIVTERCDGTLTRVTEGSVTVRDFRLGKTVDVAAGEQYFARRR